MANEQFPGQCLSTYKINQTAPDAHMHNSAKEFPMVGFSTHTEPVSSEMARISAL
jgi:hypothetical protein